MLLDNANGHLKSLKYLILNNIAIKCTTVLTLFFTNVYGKGFEKSCIRLFVMKKIKKTTTKKISSTTRILNLPNQSTLSGGLISSPPMLYPELGCMWRVPKQTQTPTAPIHKGSFWVKLKRLYAVPLKCSLACTTI